MGVPELRSAYDPPFEDVPRIALPYVSVQLGYGGVFTPRIDSRLCPSRPYCVFPREVLAPLGVAELEAPHARDPEWGNLKLNLLELRVFGDSGVALSTQARIGWPLERDVPEPLLGSFGFFSVFDVSFSPQRGIRITHAAGRG